MDLYAGLPYWLIKNPLFNSEHTLKENINIDVAIIGSGITGALVAHELCSHGIDCAVIDKRALCTGSSAASTAQLQYEIDIPLYQLLKKVSEQTAVTAYQSSLQSIKDIEAVFQQTKLDAEFERKPTLYLASDKKGLKEIEQEYEARKKYDLPVEFLDHALLQSDYNIDRPGALRNYESAQMDAYKSAISLLDYHREHNNLKLYPYTPVTSYTQTGNGYELSTEQGYTIQCKYLVIAAGYEAGKFLPKKIMDLLSTYALVSQPVPKEDLWKDECLIWETARPYFYMRTTRDNRIMLGGEDIKFKNENLRDALLDRKTNNLISKFEALFPDKKFKVDMSWCGTFSATKDGLPYIGEYPGMKQMYFALGYGGNGITFSMIAAQIIRKKINGQSDSREAAFGFTRK
jgi:glycine/D-amino acid oxidase-like deaminating enzyme